MPYAHKGIRLSENKLPIKLNKLPISLNKVPISFQHFPKPWFQVPNRGVKVLISCALSVRLRHYGPNGRGGQARVQHGVPRSLHHKGYGRCAPPWHVG